MGYSDGKREFIVTGRLLSSSLDLANGDWATEFMNKNKRRVNSSGEEFRELYLKVAFPKSDAMWTDPNGLGSWWEAAQAEANEFFRGQIPQDLWKDSMLDFENMVDKNGLPLSNRPGHTGHIGIEFKTRYPLSWTKYDFQQNKRIEVLDPNKEIKRGDYIQIAGFVQARDGKDAQGNQLRNSFPKITNTPLHATLVGYGEPIRTGRDATQIFGDAPPPMPQGASPTPVGPSQAPAGPPQGAPPMGGPFYQGYGQTPPVDPNRVTSMPSTGAPPVQGPPTGAPPPQAPPQGPPAFNANDEVPF